MPLVAAMSNSFEIVSIDWTSCENLQGVQSTPLENFVDPHVRVTTPVLTVLNFNKFVIILTKEEFNIFFSNSMF